MRDTLCMKNVLSLGLHFVEMWIAMLVGMAVFMAIPGVMSWPAVAHQSGMALAMTLPMVGWMRIRGHAWRHAIEMSAGMLGAWVVALGIVALDGGSALAWLPTAAMAAGMLGVMAAQQMGWRMALSRRLSGGWR